MLVQRQRRVGRWPDHKLQTETSELRQYEKPKGGMLTDDCQSNRILSLTSLICVGDHDMSKNFICDVVLTSSSKKKAILVPSINQRAQQDKRESEQTCMNNFNQSSNEIPLNISTLPICASPFVAFLDMLSRSKKINVSLNPIIKATANPSQAATSTPSDLHQLPSRPSVSSYDSSETSP